MSLQQVASHKIFGGEQQVWQHRSQALNCDMRFAVYLPPQLAKVGNDVSDQSQTCPVLFWLSGLTCTEQNVISKSGFQRYAADLGVIVIAPDTSPRGDDVPDDAGSYDFGKGAGFYLDATQQPWTKHYRMSSYIAEELYDLVLANFAIDPARVGIMGHSMGGHGALTLHLRFPDKFKTVSAFAPIVAPAQVPWGQKAFKGYLGEDTAQWNAYDSCELVKQVPSAAKILIDQGAADEFLQEQLKPELFQAACQQAGQELTLREHQGYDHSYYFISSFIEDHFKHHLEQL